MERERSSGDQKRRGWSLKKGSRLNSKNGWSKGEKTWFDQGESRRSPSKRAWRTGLLKKNIHIMNSVKEGKGMRGAITAVSKIGVVGKKRHRKKGSRHLITIGFRPYTKKEKEVLDRGTPLVGVLLGNQIGVAGPWNIKQSY